MKNAILQHFADDWLPFFERYLKGLKPAGKQYRALCPFHDDHNPSLFINPTSGKWFCHGCKIGGDAFTLAEKKTGLNFPEVLKSIGAEFGITGNGSKPKSTKLGKLIKRYTYQDANGAALFCKDRYEPKDFRINRSDGNGGFISGMGGVAPVLYRLPEVIAADEVWVVEGEKDADALAELGFIATTNFDGAGKWSELYNEALRGKQVILVPDHDEAGLAHVQKVAAALDGVAASIKILELPNPTGKKGYDVSDFIKEQPDREMVAERLAIMADGAKEWARKDPKGETIDDKLKSVCDSTEDGCFLEKLTDSDPDSEQYEWLIERLVPKGEPMIIAGKGASGKSSLALEFSAQIMEKDPDVGVVYICAEGTYRDTKVKARKMGLTKSNFYFLKRTGGGTSFKLSEKKDLNLVTSALTKAHNAGDKIVFVVIDSIRGMAKGSLNDDAIGEVMHSVNAELSGRLGITVCYIHHGKKNDKDMASMDAFLGSVTIVNAIRYGLFVRKKTSGLRTVEVAKSNLGNDDIFFKSEMDAIGRIQLTYEGVVGAESEANPTQLDKAEEIILSYLGQGEDERAYIIYKRGEAQGISDRTMKTAKKALGVESYQKKKTWYWRMPSHILKKHEVAQSAPKQSDLNRHEAAPYVPKQSNLNM